MKRQSVALDPDTLDGPPEMNWSDCCIYNIGGDLHFTDAGMESLAKQFVAWWKHGILPFDASMLSNSHIVGDDRVSCPNFENVMEANIEKYHHNCKNNFCGCKLNKKIESTQKKKAKLSTDHSLNLRSSPSRSLTDSPIPKCIICNEIDELKDCWSPPCHQTKIESRSFHKTN